MTTSKRRVVEPRGDRESPRFFNQGAHPPYGIRWYGATSLWGHFRNFVSTAIASESVDTRDWMRPSTPDELLAEVTRVLGVPAKSTLLESLGRPLWIDFVADTGDDRDVSEAVARMIFAEHVVVEDGAEMVLPRGDVLLFGGDTAYPVATADEIHDRVIEPWNSVLRAMGAPTTKRVLLGIPGNHDWYDGLDGFCRLFRRRDASGREEATPESESAPIARNVGLLARGMHLDEVGSALETIASAAKTTRAIWKGASVGRPPYLALDGYEPVQEASHWVLPVAARLDLWGVDRQLRNLDYRQRSHFIARRRERKDAAIWLVAPDPAIAFGEGWDFGERMLDACDLSLARDRVLYQCGDMHHYERRAVGESLHVIAGGGGAFLHGTRIVDDPKPAAAVYPSGATSRRLALTVPWQLVIGRSGYLVHIVAALLVSLELAVGWHHRQRFVWLSVGVSALIAWFLYAIAGHRRAHPRRVLALAVPFGAILGSLPVGLTKVLHDLAHFVPLLGRDAVVVVVYSFLAALLFGVFLALCALGGLEMQQVFTVLGHPGFKHFVRMRVSPDGTIDAWAIGKDDPLAEGGPWLVDRWTWRGGAGD